MLDKGYEMLRNTGGHWKILRNSQEMLKNGHERITKCLEILTNFEKQSRVI